MPLTMLPPGTRARVVALRGGAGLSRRLASMGIIPGAEILLVRGGFGGPVIVMVGEGRLVLGRGIAQRIMVQPL